MRVIYHWTYSKYKLPFVVGNFRFVLKVWEEKIYETFIPWSSKILWFRSLSRLLLYEPRRLYTYVIGVYIIETLHDYSVTMI